MVSVGIGAHPEAGSPEWLLPRYLLGRRIIMVASAAVWIITVVVAVLPNSASNVPALGIAVTDSVLTVALLQAIHASYENAFYRAVGG